MAALKPARAEKTDQVWSTLQAGIGATVNLILEGSQRQFKLTLLGLSAGQGLIISAPLQTFRPVEKQLVTVRLIAGNFFCTFSCQLLQVQQSPYPHWHLSYPDHLLRQRIRQFERVPVNLAVVLDHQDELAGMRLGLPRRVHCRDLSLQGACLEASEPIGQSGDLFFITFRFRIQTLDQLVLVPAQLRRQHLESAGVVLHHMGYQPLEEEVQLLMNAFFYQQYLYELGYLGYD